jgi:hypothetical protein
VFPACSAVICGQSTSIRGMVVKQWTNLPPVKAGDQIISMNANGRGVVVEVYSPSANSHTTVYYQPSPDKPFSPVLDDSSGLFGAEKFIVPDPPPSLQITVNLVRPRKDGLYVEALDLATPSRGISGLVLGPTLGRSNAQEGWSCRPSAGAGPV